MLGLVTSLSIARALAARQGDAFDANQEVRAQGLSNLLGPWLSASLSAGSFTRSGLNLEAGARSRWRVRFRRSGWFCWPCSVRA